MDTLPETNITFKNRPSQMEIHLPTINFQGQAVSFRKGKVVTCCNYFLTFTYGSILFQDLKKNPSHLQSCLTDGSTALKVSEAGGCVKGNPSSITIRIYPSSHNHGSVENGCMSNISFLSFGVIFHFHDYGRKGTPPKKLTWEPEHWWFVDVFPFPGGHFQLPC